HNSLFVAAAGNDGSDNDTAPVYPSSYDLPNVVSVAATDNNDGVAYFSNVGRQSVDLGAPGVAIYSTWLGGGYQHLSGTSLTTPGRSSTRSGEEVRGEAGGPSAPGGPTSSDSLSAPGRNGPETSNGASASRLSLPRSSVTLWRALMSCRTTDATPVTTNCYG